MNVLVFVTALLAVAALAVRWGGAPERWMAIMFVAAALLSHLVYAAPTRRYEVVEAYVAGVDLLLMAGIVALLLLADRFWPIAMFAAHGVTVLAHGVKMLDSHIIRHAYAIAIASPAYLTLLILFAAVMRHQHRLRTAGADRDWSAA